MRKLHQATGGQPVRDPALGWRAGEALQILQHGRDQGSPARVFGRQCCRIEAENITGLLRGFLPVRRRGLGEVRFELLRSLASTSASNRRRSVAF
jgi:hypothetical protein